MLVVVLPLLVVVGLLIFILFKNYPGEEPHDLSFLLLVAPGCFVFLAGFVLGFVWLRNPARSLLALRIRHAGMTLLLLVPDIWLAWLAATGHANPEAWLGVVVLTAFVALRIYAFSGIREVWGKAEWPR